MKFNVSFMSLHFLLFRVYISFILIFSFSIQVLTKPKQCICKILVKNERIMNISIYFILDNDLYFLRNSTYVLTFTGLKYEKAQTDSIDVIASINK